MRNYAILHMLCIKMINDKIVFQIETKVNKFKR